MLQRPDLPSRNPKLAEMLDRAQKRKRVAARWSRAGEVFAVLGVAVFVGLVVVSTVAIVGILLGGAYWLVTGNPIGG